MLCFWCPPLTYTKMDTRLLQLYNNKTKIRCLFNLALVKSHGVRVCASVIRQWSRGIEFSPSTQPTQLGVWLNCQSSRFTPFLLTTQNNFLKPKKQFLCDKNDLRWQKPYLSKPCFSHLEGQDLWLALRPATGEGLQWFGFTFGELLWRPSSYTVSGLYQLRRQISGS